VNKSEKGGVKVITKNKIVHADYDANTVNNDVALLKLDQPVKFNSNV
jgi:hypothetical protein